MKTLNRLPDSCDVLTPSLNVLSPSSYGFGALSKSISEYVNEKKWIEALSQFGNVTVLKQKKFKPPGQFGGYYYEVHFRIDTNKSVPEYERLHLEGYRNNGCFMVAGLSIWKDEMPVRDSMIRVKYHFGQTTEENISEVVQAINDKVNKQ